MAADNVSTGARATGTSLIGDDRTGSLSKDGAAGETEKPASSTTGRPLAFVYRGPASCDDGCPEAAVALLRSSKWNFDVRYIGPNERTKITSANLATAALYFQPGGGDSFEDAFAGMRPSEVKAIQSFVKDGGRYVGVCMGGYFAGRNPGLNLIPANVDDWIYRSGASVRGTDDTLVKVNWRGKPRTMFYQEGPSFRLNASAQGVTVLARYVSNNDIAALVAPYGKGKVGVVGPHPEADQSWYSYNGLRDPDGVDADLGRDLIDTTMTGSDLRNRLWGLRLDLAFCDRIVPKNS